MGISTEQWRAAIGAGARCVAPLCCPRSSASEGACYEEPDLRSHRRTPLLNIPWKIASLGLLLVCLASTCQATLLVMGGVEANPGPPKSSTAGQQPQQVSPETQAIRDGQQAVLDKLCAMSTSESVRNTIRLYDVTKSSAKNHDNLTKCSKPQLVETMDYLKTENQEPYLKDAVIDNLISRLMNLFPDKCQICSEAYTIELDERPLICCAMCGQGCHSCMAELLGIAQDEVATITNAAVRNKINPHSIPGIHYMCSYCSKPGVYLPDPEQAKTKKSKAKEQQKTALAPAAGAGAAAAVDDASAVPLTAVKCAHAASRHAASRSEAPPADGSGEPRSQVAAAQADDDDDDDAPDDAFVNRVASAVSPRERIIRRHHKSGDDDESRAPIPPSDKSQEPGKSSRSRRAQRKKKGLCWKYAKGKCEHGMKGTGCDKNHPEPCFKYLKNGTRPGRGCQKGSECDKFHVKLCQSSLTKEECFDENCVKHHTTGTRRQNSRPLCKTSLDRRECFDESCNLYHQKGTRRVPPRQQHKPTGIEKPNNAHINQQHFLEEVVKSLRAEINQAVSSQIIGLLRSESLSAPQQESRIIQPAAAPAAPNLSWPQLGQLLQSCNARH